MKFLVFEGLDGAGKSTLIQRVEAYLLRQSMDVSRVRDPGTTLLGEKIRQLILDPLGAPSAKTEILLYQAARAQLVAEMILPHLKQKRWVLSDRFYSSTIAFQCAARGLSRTDVDWLNHYACDGLKPDLVIFIDIPVQESQRRISSRTANGGEQKDRMENEDLSFHEKVRQGYLSQAQENPQNWLVLDGFQKPEVLVELVIAAMKGFQWLS